MPGRHRTDSGWATCWQQAPAHSWVRSSPPRSLAALGSSHDTVWAVANAVVGLLILGAVGFLANASARGSVPPRTPRVFWSFLGSGALIATALILAALGIGLPGGPSVLLLALIWGLLAAFAQLAPFVLVTWSGDP